MNDIISKLDRINWNFEKKIKYPTNIIAPLNCRKYFSYPATFIPEIPFSLIEILSNEGDVVMDPFGGIGTTFFQAVIQQRLAYSYDNNRIASIVTNELFALLEPEINWDMCINYILDTCSDYNANIDYSEVMQGKRAELQGWFHKETFNQIAYLTMKYDEIDKRVYQKEASLFHLCLLGILPSVCSQNGGWAYIADNVKPKADKLSNKSALTRFEFLKKQIKTDFENYQKTLGEGFLLFYSKMKESERIINSDIINDNIEQKPNSVNLIVSSPPYPNMIDYVKSQRLAYYMEGLELKDELEKEIGARYRRNKNQVALENYLHEMEICNKRMHQILKKGGILCYILPKYSEEDKRGSIISKVILDCINTCEFEEVYRIERCIPGTQRANNVKWASLSKEEILILEKK